MSIKGLQYLPDIRTRFAPAFLLFVLTTTAVILSLLHLHPAEEEVTQPDLFKPLVLSSIPTSMLRGRRSVAYIPIRMRRFCSKAAKSVSGVGDHRTPRIYHDAELKRGDIIEFEAAQSNYIAQVMRMKVDSCFRIFDGINGEFEARIQQVDKRHTTVVIEELLRQQNSEAGTKHPAKLIFSPLKSKSRMQFLVEKATELGVEEIYPVVMQRTEVSKINMNKLTRYTVEASEQCERLSLPVVQPISSLEDLLQKWPESQPLFCCLERGNSKGILEDLKSRENLSGAGYIIGPEGGFTAQEQDLLSEHHQCSFVSLGPLILRAETAAIAALSAHRLNALALESI
mmetsp:Transcript_1927/g.3047  ORF Transcript_1927/g.3047 Transcript_1927/m.3047 type:complete len:342 (+) Transcript_1927:104-1129(+)